MTPFSDVINQPETALKGLIRSRNTIHVRGESRVERWRTEAIYFILSRFSVPPTFIEKNTFFPFDKHVGSYIFFRQDLKAL